MKNVEINKSVDVCQSIFYYAFWIWTILLILDKIDKIIALLEGMK
ncbi:MAG: hypothetical protein WC329_05825 [Candidatus Omnitrophota bacterium]|jgi:hypothetical protein